MNYSTNMCLSRRARLRYSACRTTKKVKRAGETPALRKPTRGQSGMGSVTAGAACCAPTGSGYGNTRPRVESGRDGSATLREGARGEFLRNSRKTGASAECLGGVTAGAACCAPTESGYGNTRPGVESGSKLPHSIESRRAPFGVQRLGGVYAGGAAVASSVRTRSGRKPRPTT